MTIPCGVVGPSDGRLEEDSTRRLDHVGVESVLGAMIEVRDRRRASEPELRPYNPLSVPTPVSIPFSRDRLAFSAPADALDDDGAPRVPRRKEPDSGSFLKTR